MKHPNTATISPEADKQSVASHDKECHRSFMSMHIYIYLYIYIPDRYYFAPLISKGNSSSGIIGSPKDYFQHSLELPGHNSFRPEKQRARERERESFDTHSLKEGGKVHCPGYVCLHLTYPICCLIFSKIWIKTLRTFLFVTVKDRTCFPNWQHHAAMEPSEALASAMEPRETGTATDGNHLGFHGFDHRGSFFAFLIRHPYLTISSGGRNGDWCRTLNQTNHLVTSEGSHCQVSGRHCQV